MLALIFFLFVFFLVISVPIGFVLGIIPLIFTFLSNFPSTAIPTQMFSGLNSFPLLAIPLFILAGDLMNSTKITHQLLELANTIIGHIRGGLANINILVSMLFSGLNGSIVADTVSIGSILIPAMEKEGYDKNFSAAVTAASSMIGGIIPPSVNMVLYGSTLGISIGALFAAGIIPGLLFGIVLIIISTVISIKKGFPVHSSGFSIIAFLKAFKNCFLPLLMPLIIIGGIIGGVFTATEAAGIAVSYALFLGFIVYRNLTLTEFINSLYRSGKLAGVILLIVGASSPFAWMIMVLNIPQILTDFIISITTNKIIILILLNVFFLMMGMILDATANILILGPIMLPVSQALGFNDIHFAMIMIVNLIVGLGTPPVGTVLFASAPIAGTTLEGVAKAILPFIIGQIFILILVTYIPAISTWIPSLLGYI
jgi:tripartite ATP-independent transporter DctM subunit